MLGKYWIDKKENGEQSSFIKMFEGQPLNADEEAIFGFVKEAQERYERIVLFGQKRLTFSSLDKHLANASENTLEALAKCCVLTHIFVPIKEITEGEYKNSLSYSQRHALWKGTGFKGVRAYAGYFVSESVSQSTPIVENLFELHKQLDIKDCSLQEIYEETLTDALANPQKQSLWKSTDEKAVEFCNAAFAAYPDLKVQKTGVKKISHSLPTGILNNLRQKTL